MCVSSVSALVKSNLSLYLNQFHSFISLHALGDATKIGPSFNDMTHGSVAVAENISSLNPFFKMNLGSSAGDMDMGSHRTMSIPTSILIAFCANSSSDPAISLDSSTSLQVEVVLKLQFAPIRLSTGSFHSTSRMVRGRCDSIEAINFLSILCNALRGVAIHNYLYWILCTNHFHPNIVDFVQTITIFSHTYNAIG